MTSDSTKTLFILCVRPFLLIKSDKELASSHKSSAAIETFSKKKEYDNLPPVAEQSVGQPYRKTSSQKVLEMEKTS